MDGLASCGRPAGRASVLPSGRAPKAEVSARTLLLQCGAEKRQIKATIAAVLWGKRILSKQYLRFFLRFAACNPVSETTISDL
jgi:hypothetical protein